MYTIYLAGYISGKKIKECMAWRKEIREKYDHWKEKSNVDITEVGFKDNKSWERYPICWLDPLNGQQFESIDKEGLHSSVPGTALVNRDYWCVKKSDLLIVNLDTFGCTRPLTGTIYELAWAWEFKIPVIAIKGEDHYNDHPFLKDTVKIWVNSIEELIDKKWINYFYKSSVSAIY